MIRSLSTCIVQTRIDWCKTLLAACIVMALTGTAAIPRAFAQSQSGFLYNGIVYTSYQADEYQEMPQGPQGTSAIRTTGANYTSVLVTQYMQTYTSNIIAAETASTPGYNSQTDPLSPTDDAVVAAIQNLQAQGLTVVMKPQVDSLDGVFRGSFAPTDVAAWFASYQTFILHYAQIAAQNNVGDLIVGTELKSLSGAAYETYWDNIIAQIRSSYPSLTLIYGANATGADDEFTTVSFWDKVDIIGVDGYFPLTNQIDPTVAQLVAGWTNNNGFNAVAALQALQAEYNKPLIFTEVGYVSEPGTNEEPYSSTPPGGTTYDPTAQENCYEAFFEVFSQETAWMKGVFWWQWNVSPPGNNDTGYTPQNKSAATVTLPKWFGSTIASFSLAPSTSLLGLNAGASTPVTLAITDLGGFTGSVTLAASGVPSGVSASFAPGSVAGTQVLTLTASNAAATGQSTITITGTSGTLTASTAITLNVQALASQTISFANPGAQTVGTPLIIAGTASSGLTVAFTSATNGVCTVSNTTATFLAAGTCTIDANQAGNLTYAPAATVAQSFMVNSAPNPPGIALTPASNTVSLPPGSTATDHIAVTGTGGFSGMVSFSAVLTSMPQGALDIPTFSFSTNPVNVSTASGGMAILTIATTSTTAALAHSETHTTSLVVEGGGALACLLFLGFPTRRRKVRTTLGIIMTFFLLLLPGGILGCGGGHEPETSNGSNGTTAGSYVVTVTASSGSTIATLPITITVQ